MANRAGGLGTHSRGSDRSNAFRPKPCTIARLYSGGRSRKFPGGSLKAGNERGDGAQLANAEFTATTPPSTRFHPPHQPSPTLSRHLQRQPPAQLRAVFVDRLDNHEICAGREIAR